MFTTPVKVWQGAARGANGLLLVTLAFRYEIDLKRAGRDTMIRAAAEVGLQIELGNAFDIQVDFVDAEAWGLTERPGAGARAATAEGDYSDDAN